ncbi:hypothetical protein VP01_758g4 [Puccinia sorghi]|uniref:Uncharacterized protein n=1 Tax=Puccinia sorghi TaxID=27349 RepID=A0A0L6UCU5_9BASI|nr:hypothetical protein VP01_758g4 [Puccinia sorghi]
MNSLRIIPKLRFANNPTELIVRIQQLTAKKTQLAHIIHLIKSSSTSVATISVWTELFKLLISHKKQHWSYKLFLEIKRRQIKPDTQFFHHYFHLISTAEPSPTKHFTLHRLESLWKQATATSSQHHLTNPYLNCLIKHGFTSHAFQYFNSLPTNSIDSTTLYHVSKSLSSSNPQHLQQAQELIQKFQHEQQLLDLRNTLSFANLFLKSNDTNHHEYASHLIQERLGIQLQHNPYQFWAKTKHKPILTPNQQQPTNQLSFEPGQLTTLLRMLLKMKKFALIRKLWAQITTNPDLYLQRDTLDSTHCGLVMVAMGRCGAMGEVEGEKIRILSFILSQRLICIPHFTALICWMIESGNKRLRPNHDTLDKAIQAAWQTEDLSAGISILASLTHKISLLEPHEEAEKAIVELSRKGIKGMRPLEPSNRALATLLQAAGRIGKVAEIGRALETVAKFRMLPDPPTPTANSKGTGPTTVLGVPESSEEIERYWADQFIWVATDLLDKLLSRPDHLPKIFSVEQMQNFSDWRTRIDQHLQQDPASIPLRSRIESRAQERLTRLQSRTSRNRDHRRQE